MNQPRAIIRNFLSLILLWPMMFDVHAQDLGPWRPLTPEEEQARIGDVPADSADPSIIEGDFDGDGSTDKALIAIRTVDGARDLIVFMKTDQIYPIMIDTVEPHDGLRLAEPGPWDTICGNAFRRFHRKMCASGYPRQINLKNSGILVVQNGQTSLFFWEAKKKRFDAVILVD